MTGRVSAVLVLLAGILTGCVESRSRPTVPVFGDLAVSSDPEGARISVDGRDVGLITPDTLADAGAGGHLLDLRLETGPLEAFSWEDSVEVPEESLDSVDAALEGGCGRDCPFRIDKGRIVCRLNGLGDTCASAFFTDVPGLQWPGTTGRYAAGGRLMAAGILGADAGALAGDTMATLVYRQSWVGRSPVHQSGSTRRQITRLDYWATSLLRPAPLLGLGVQEQAVAVDSASARDILFLHFRVRNVSGDPRYRRLYPEVPAGGYTFDQLYLGFGLDADVGNADDDLGTFDPARNLAFMYDADFQDAALGSRSNRPGMVGLATIEPPAGADRRTLTLWPSADDWDDGLAVGFAWRLLAGKLGAGDPIADHPDPEIGFVSGTPDDYRMAEAYGPLTLKPGDAVDLTVAILMAEPVADTFTPGELVRPGDPTVAGRRILQIAGTLRDLASRAPDLWTRYEPAF